MTEDELKSPEEVSDNYTSSRLSFGASTRSHQRGQNELIIQSREALARMGNELELERGKVLQLTNDITHARRELAHERSTSAALQRDVSVLHEKETQMMRELSLLKANERVFKAKCEELERELERKDKTVSAENARLEYLESELSSKQQQQTESARELEQYTNQSERIINDLQNQLKEVIESEQKLSEVAQARKTRLDEANEAIRTCDEQLTKLENKNKALEADLQNKNKALETELVRVKAELAAATSSQQDASHGIKEHLETNSKLRAEVERLNKVHWEYTTKTERTIEDLNRTLEGLRSTNRDTVLEQRGAEKDLHTLQQRNADLEQIVAASASRISQLEEQVASGNSAREALLQSSSASSNTQRADLQRTYEERMKQVEEFGKKREAEMTALFQQRFDILKEEKSELQRQIAEKDTQLFQANAQLRGSSYASPTRAAASTIHTSRAIPMFGESHDPQLSAIVMPAPSSQLASSSSAVEAELRKQIAALEHKRHKLKRKYEAELRKLKETYENKLQRMKAHEKESLRERDDDYDKALALLKSRYAANIGKCKDHLRGSHALLQEKRKESHALETRVKQEMARSKQLASKVAQLQSIRQSEMTQRNDDRQGKLRVLQKQFVNEQKMRMQAEQEAQRYSEQLASMKSSSMLNDRSSFARSSATEQRNLLDALRGIVKQHAAVSQLHDDNSCVLEGSNAWTHTSSNGGHFQRNALLQKLDHIIERVERQLDRTGS